MQLVVMNNGRSLGPNTPGTRALPTQNLVPLVHYVVHVYTVCEQEEISRKRHTWAQEAPPIQNLVPLVWGAVHMFT